MNEQLPPIPRLKLDSLLLEAHTLQILLRQRAGQTMTPDLARHVGGLIGERLGYPNPHNCVQTLIQYSGQILTPAFTETLAWQFAGRERDLADGPLVAFERPVRDEWVAMEVESVHDVAWRDTKPGIELKLRCFNGHPAGHMIPRKLPLAFLRSFLVQIGWSKRQEFDNDPRHAIGLWLWGYLRPVPDSDEVRFDEFALSSAFKKHNRYLLRLRTRYDVDDPKVECPYQFEHHCFECQVRKDECPATIHRRPASSRSQTPQAR